MATVPYNPNDPKQAAFLSRIRAAESGDNYFIGYGGVDLRGYRTDDYGFPQWSGARTSHGPTHAAGAYQFQPATWREVATRYGPFDFRRPADQDAAAWYLAQERYAAYSGGNLTTALQAGQQEEALRTLSPTWAAFTPPGGSQEYTGAPAAQAAEEYNGGGTGMFQPVNMGPLASSGANPVSLELGSTTTQNVSSWLGFGGSIFERAINGLLSSLENWFARGAAVFVGLLLIGAAVFAMVMQRKGE